MCVIRQPRCFDKFDDILLNSRECVQRIALIPRDVLRDVFLQPFWEAHYRLSVRHFDGDDGHDRKLIELEVLLVIDKRITAFLERFDHLARGRCNATPRLKRNRGDKRPVSDL